MGFVDECFPGGVVCNSDLGHIRDSVVHDVVLDHNADRNVAHNGDNGDAMDHSATGRRTMDHRTMDRNTTR